MFKGTIRLDGQNESTFFLPILSRPLEGDRFNKKKVSLLKNLYFIEA